jgi:hypothetical protein
MTMRLDIVTNDAGEGVRREHARELGAGVVVAISRLAKLAQLHDLTNQAFTRQLEQTHQIIGDYGLRSGSNVNVMFADKAVFVAGQLLKGSRGTYEAATELGELFARLGGSELHIQRDLTREELLAFAEQISLGYRSAAGSFRSPTPKIRLRVVADAARLRGLELETLTADQRIVRMYASAVVIMRRFFEDLQGSRYILPRRIKRIAQSLVDLSEGSTPAFLGVTEVRNANFDEAGRAVNTAILAVSMAREVTSERAILSQIAMAGMMHDVARPRAMALSQAGGPPVPGMQAPTTLSEDQEDRLPAGAAAVLTALGRLNEPSITRTVLTFEALWLRRQTWLGPVYWGARAPTLHAKIIAIARRYNDLLTPEPGLAPPTPDYAIAVLSEQLQDPHDRTVLRMLVAALGLLPMGTVVQLTTGELAEVVRGPKGPGEKARVRVLKNANGQPVDPVEIELAQDPRRRVSRVVSVEGWRKGLELEPRTGGDHYDPDGEARPQEEPSAASRIQSSERSTSSVGTSPSAVAEAMGRMISDSLRPAVSNGSEPPDVPPPSAPSAEPADRMPSRMPRRAREATAKGNLAATPLPHVLVYMLEHSLSGSVVFDSAERSDTIHFVAGVPSKIRLHDRFALLGQMLLHGGAIDAKTLGQAVEGALRLGVLLGEYLVGHELVPRETLVRALEAQVFSKIAHLANLSPATTYSYFREVDLLEGWGGGDVKVRCALNPILASVRSWQDRARIRATLGRVGKHALLLHEDAALTDIALVAGEQAVLDIIRAESPTLAELLERHVVDEEVASSLVYSLAVTRQFAFKGQKKTPMGSKSGPAWQAASVQSSPPPASQAPPPASVRPGVSGAPRSMAPAVLPSAPGAPRVAPQIRPIAPRKATTVGVQPPLDEESFLDGAPTIARPAPPIAGTLRPAFLAPSTVPGAVELGDEAGGGADAALAAMQSFRMAEAALQRNDLAAAQQLARRSVEGDPRQPDYVMLLAWIQALDGNVTSLQEAIETMTRVLGDDPSSERALLYRAKLLARGNRRAEAVADFEALLDANPQHREAQAELHQLTTKRT